MVWMEQECGWFRLKTWKSLNVIPRKNMHMGFIGTVLENWNVEVSAMWAHSRTTNSRAVGGLFRLSSHSQSCPNKIKLRKDIIEAMKVALRSSANGGNLTKIIAWGEKNDWEAILICFSFVIESMGTQKNWKSNLLSVWSNVSKKCSLWLVVISFRCPIDLWLYLQS